jgi:hypothetical protein
MNLTPTQLTLVSLLGKKDLTFGCVLESEEYSTWNHFLYESIDGKYVTIGTQYPIIENWNKEELKIV